MILQFTKIIEINQLKMNLCISEWYQEHLEKEAKVHHVLYVTPSPQLISKNCQNIYGPLENLNYVMNM